MNPQAETNTEKPARTSKKEEQVDPWQDLKGFTVGRADLVEGFEIHLHGVHTVLQTAEHNPNSKTRAISMKYTALGIACKLPIKNKNLDKTIYFMIPHANVKGVTV